MISNSYVISRRWMDPLDPNGIHEVVGSIPSSSTKKSRKRAGWTIPNRLFYHLTFKGLFLTSVRPDVRLADIFYLLRVRIEPRQIHPPGELPHVGKV
jgi:hypothetical protein